MILQLTEMQFSFVFNKSPFIVTCMIVFNRETFNYNEKLPISLFLSITNTNVKITNVITWFKLSTG